MKRKAIVWMMVVGCSSPLVAQPVAEKRTINTLQYNAYLSQDGGDELWKQAIETWEGSLKNQPDHALHYQLALAHVGLLNSTLKTHDEMLFDAYYDKTIDLLDQLIASNKNWAEPYALQAAACGVKIAYNPMYGMILGPKSNSLISKAIKLDSTSALVLKIYGNTKLFTPDMWGGDVSKAIKAYEKSIHLFEISAPSTAQTGYTWMHSPS